MLAKTKPVTTGADKLTYFDEYLDVGSFFANRNMKLEEDDHLSARPTTNPVYGIHWIIALASQGFQSTVSIQAECTYYIKFYGRKGLLGTADL